MTLGMRRRTLAALRHGNFAGVLCMHGKSAGANVAILGHYGAANLGDEAIIQAVIRCFDLRLHGGKIIGISANPNDTKKRHGITAFPVRRYFATRSELSVTAVNGADKAMGIEPRPDPRNCVTTLNAHRLASVPRSSFDHPPVPLPGQERG